MPVAPWVPVAESPAGQQPPQQQPQAPPPAEPVGPPPPAEPVHPEALFEGFWDCQKLDEALADFVFEEGDCAVVLPMALDHFLAIDSHTWMREAIRRDHVEGVMTILQHWSQLIYYETFDRYVSGAKYAAAEMGPGDDVRDVLDSADNIRVAIRGEL